MNSEEQKPGLAISLADYGQVLYWKLSDHKMLLVALNVVGVLLIGGAFAMFAAWARLWHSGNLSTAMTTWQMMGIWVGIALTIVLHELTHGLALRSYGARPKYGVMWKEMMFYATAPGHAFRRNAYLVIALAPLVGLSVLGLILLALPLPGWLLWIIIFCASLNAGSAIGDLWLVRVALGYPPVALIVDEKDGLRVFMPVTKTQMPSTPG